VIRSDDLPLSPAYSAFCGAAGVGALPKALAGGEDYELLFTARPEGAERVRALGREEGCPPISVIGQILAGPERLYLEDADGGRTALQMTGFDHFRERDPPEEG
jgi:thiamine-monophosphate kinase